MSVRTVYTTAARVTGGRDGHAASLDGALDVDLSMPRQLGGLGGGGTNPEQLFAAAYAACFIGAMNFVAARESALIVPSDTSITALVGVGPRAEGGFGLTVSMAVNLPGLEQDVARLLVARAHQICPYSNATRNNVDVKLALA